MGSNRPQRHRGIDPRYIPRHTAVVPWQTLSVSTYENPLPSILESEGVPESTEPVMFGREILTTEFEPDVPWLVVSSTYPGRGNSSTLQSSSHLEPEIPGLPTPPPSTGKIGITTPGPVPGGIGREPAHEDPIQKAQVKEKPTQERSTREKTAQRKQENPTSQENTCKPKQTRPKQSDLPALKHRNPDITDKYYQKAEQKLRDKNHKEVEPLNAAVAFFYTKIYRRRIATKAALSRRRLPLICGVNPEVSKKSKRHPLTITVNASDMGSSAAFPTTSTPSQPPTTQRAKRPPPSQRHSFPPGPTLPPVVPTTKEAPSPSARNRKTTQSPHRRWEYLIDVLDQEEAAKTARREEKEAAQQAELKRKSRSWTPAWKKHTRIDEITKEKQAVFENWAEKRKRSEDRIKRHEEKSIELLLEYAEKKRKKHDKRMEEDAKRWRMDEDDMFSWWREKRRAAFEKRMKKEMMEALDEIGKNIMSMMNDAMGTHWSERYKEKEERRAARRTEREGAMGDGKKKEGECDGGNAGNE